MATTRITLAPILSILILALALAGCGTTYWVKPGASEVDFRRESYECKRDMRHGHFGGDPILSSVMANDFYEECMESKGWRESHTVKRLPETPGTGCPAGTRWSGAGCVSSSIPKTKSPADCPPGTRWTGNAPDFCKD